MEITHSAMIEYYPDELFCPFSYSRTPRSSRTPSLHVVEGKINKFTKTNSDEILEKFQEKEPKSLIESDTAKLKEED